MKEIKFYPDRSYATRMISTGTISLEEAISLCKTYGLIVMVLKSSNDELEFFQIIRVLPNNTVVVLEGCDCTNRIHQPWHNSNVNNFMEGIIYGFPHTEGYYVESFREVVKIISVTFPGWMP